jgi:hypothetical protein
MLLICMANPIDQRNSSIPKFSSENMFVGPRLGTENYIDGRISALDFKLLTKEYVLKRGEHSTKNYY